MKLTAIFLLALVAAALVPANTLAQHGTNPEMVGESTITGTILNQSSDAPVPENMDVMLHAWNKNNEDMLMLHGLADAQGNYEFSNIAFDPSLVYSVMTSYEGASYYSDRVVVEGDEEAVVIDAPFYESTADISNVRISQMHVLILPDRNGLRIMEAYILSNSGKYTVQDTYTVEGKPAALKFPLPGDAFGVSFESGNRERFLRFPGGFADTAPLPPGEQSRQVVVSYLLDFPNGTDYSYLAPLPVDQVNFLIPHSTILALESTALVYDGPQSFGDGQAFEVYSVDNLASGDAVDLTIVSPENSTPQPDAIPIENETPETSGLLFGAGSVGLALVAAGIWWYRKDRTDPGDDEIWEPEEAAEADRK